MIMLSRPTFERFFETVNENEGKSSECASHFNNFGKYRILAIFMPNFGTLTKRKFDVKSSGRCIGLRNTQHMKTIKNRI